MHFVGSAVRDRGSRRELPASKTAFSSLGSRLRRRVPLALRVDPSDTANRYLAPTYIVRATVGDTTAPPETVATHSYLFINRVVELSPDQDPPGDSWPESGGGHDTQMMDYGMDPDVTRSSEYSALIDESLRALPSLSLVTDLDSLFHPTQGIYVNAMEEGEDWERFGSIELLNVDGTPGFQANAGIRIRGGVSRGPHNPKHAFRLFFRGDYGTPKLESPLFEGEGTSRFDKVDLRTTQNYSWNMDGGGDFNLNTMNRDVFSRDLQREMGKPYTRSRYYHLYLDGVYWGLFQTEERPDAWFAETYLGGERDDYDVVKVERDVIDGTSSYYVQATDGTLDSWQQLWNACQTGFNSDAAYYRLEGRDATGARDPSLPVLVDIDNLIDFMLIIFYGANLDAPVSKWFANESPNNFYALWNRVEPSRGFVFVAHDNEHTLIADRVLITTGVDENRVSIGEPGGATDGSGRINDRYQMNVTQFEWFQPQWLHHRLTSNAEYRARIAERAHAVLGAGGLMTAQPATDLFNARIAEIELAIIAESARWGDAQRPDRPRTENDDWLPAVERVVDGFLARRTPIVIQQLTDAGLY